MSYDHRLSITNYEDRYWFGKLLISNQTEAKTGDENRDATESIGLVFELHYWQVRVHTKISDDVYIPTRLRIKIYPKAP